MRKIISLLCVIVIVVGMFAGCGQNSQSQTDNGENISTTPTEGTKNETTDTNQLLSNTITVAEIKQKYGESDDGKILPLYNLDPQEPLAIALKYTPTDERAVFSIHTDEKCLPESEISLMWDYSSYSSSGPKTYNVRPIMGALSYDRDNEGYWGNVSNYYIKFNYDITADTEIKLENPVIVPMSIKSPSAIPDVDYEIKDGRFILKWDAVDGATSYKIYNCSNRELLTTSNKQPNGKEVAYKANLPRLVAEVNADVLYYQDWLENGTNGMTPVQSEDVIGGYINNRQNQGVNGEYYVTAIVDGKESLFSIGINTCNMSLPAEIKGTDSILNNTYEKMADLPKTIDVVYVDGSTSTHNLSYEAKQGSSAVTYKVVGTAMVGSVFVKSGEQKVPADANSAQDTSGFVEAENNIPQNAPTDMPTVNETNNNNEPDSTPPDTEPTTPTEPTPTVPVTPPTEPENDDTETLIEQQIDNTDKVLEEANKETVKVVDEIIVNADSAAEEYLALNMIAGNTEFSIAAFPEIQNWSILTDVFSKTMYQNPFILGVNRYGYDYKTMTVMVEYKYSTTEIESRQDEIITEGKKIIESIITTDMDDAEKRRAIYDYLEANTSYDHAALDNAKENNYQSVDDSFRDSFSTYGILVNKVGVCQSYAYVFDYLCELVDVECITVTGYMAGSLPHAWNKVKIGNEWFVIDVTNNEKSLGIEDFMFENPDQIATALGYTENDEYYTISEEGTYTSQNTDYSKYKNCLINNKVELNEYIAAHANSNTIVEFVAMYSDFSVNDVMEALRETSIVELGESKVISGYVWFQIIK